MTFALVALLAATGLDSRGSADVAPGDVITKLNVEKVDGLVAEGVKWAIINGMDLQIVPYQNIPMPKAYLAATEKYGGQSSARLAQRAAELGRGQAVSDHRRERSERRAEDHVQLPEHPLLLRRLGLHLVDADTGNLYVDANGNRHYSVERHFVADWLRVLQFEGRLHHDPRPRFEKNSDETFRKSGLYPLIEPFDLKGVGGVSFRYQDLIRQDDTWLYLPFLRRVRRLSSAQRSDALFGQDIDVDSYGGYAGQIPWFDWKLLGEKPMLASLHGERLPPEPCTKDGGMTFCEVWEKRPSVYVIEGKPKVSNYAYSKRVIYVDKETNFVIYSDLYDQNGELWKVVMQSIRTSQAAEPEGRLRVRRAAHVHLRVQRDRHAAHARHARGDSGHRVPRRSRLVHRRRLQPQVLGREKTGTRWRVFSAAVARGSNVQEEQGSWTSLGLLLLRVGAGGMMLLGHGWAKLAGFADMAEHFPDPLGLGSSTLSLGTGGFRRVLLRGRRRRGLRHAIRGGPPRRHHARRGLRHPRRRPLGQERAGLALRGPLHHLGLHWRRQVLGRRQLTVRLPPLSPRGWRWH